MSREDNGDMSQVEADEDIDPDVLIGEEELRRVGRRLARQRIEDMKEEKGDD